MHICKKLENAECSLLLTLLNCILKKKNAVYVIQCQISNSPYLFSIQFLETGLGEFGVISSEILQVFLFSTFYQFVEWIMF